MDRNYIDTHLAVDRYLHGSLEGDELAEFEERLLWDAELRDDLDLAERLQEGLRDVERRTSVAVERASLVDRLVNWLYVPQYAAATSFALAVALTVGVFVSPLMQVDDRPGGEAMPTEIIPLISTRGTDAPTIYVDPESWVVLLVDTPRDYELFRVSVLPGEGDEPVWTQDNLKTTYPDALAVGMPGRALSAGDYVLVVDGVRVSDTEARSYLHIQNIRFRAESPE